MKKSLLIVSGRVSVVIYCSFFSGTDFFNQPFYIAGTDIIWTYMKVWGNESLQEDASEQRMTKKIY